MLFAGFTMNIVAKVFLVFGWYEHLRNHVAMFYDIVHVIDTNVLRYCPMFYDIVHVINIYVLRYCPMFYDIVHDINTDVLR